MDNSVYVASQTTPMLQLIQGAAAPDDEPVDFGPVVWDVLGKVASSVGGATYLIGRFFSSLFFLSSLVFLFYFYCELCASFVNVD